MPRRNLAPALSVNAYSSSMSTNRSGRSQVFELRKFWKTITVDPSFPDASVSQSDVIFCDLSFLATASHQDHAVVGDGSNRPEFVDLIRISLAALRWMNINSARTGIDTLFRDTKDHRITRLVIMDHLSHPCSRIDLTWRISVTC